jgi:NhaP-type Na+/H+ or K+/H+ antiporter
MEPTFQRLSALPLAILAYVLAEVVGGNGFITVMISFYAHGISALPFSKLYGKNTV